MTTKISKKDRIEASRKIVDYVLAKYVFADDQGKFIRTIYNHAVEDLADVLEELAKHNPEHRLAYRLAAEEFRKNYPLIAEDE